MRSTLRLGVGLGTFGLGVTLAEKLPLAFHEAGHAILGYHFGDAGFVCEGMHGSIALQGSAPTLLRYATIQPRKHKGSTYLGETKLSVRWRDMHEHVQWRDEDSHASAQPILLLSSLGNTASTVTHVPSAAVGLARMAYLLAGRAAEDQLFGTWPMGGAKLDDNDAAPAHLARRVHSIVCVPGTASGDVRKAKQVAATSLGVCGVGVAEGSLEWHEATERALCSAFSFAEGVLRLRWHDVCMLAGALFVRGTCDGSQFKELVRLLSTALIHHGKPQSLGQDECVLCEHLLASMAASFPFCFGCIVAITKWPRRDPRLPGPPHS